MILLTIAFPYEVKIIKEEIKKLNLKGVQVDFLLTGVGVLNTIYSIKDYISKNTKPDFIINLGVCGKTNEIFNDFLQVYRIKNLSNNKESLCPIYIKYLDLKSIACSDKIITNENEVKDENFVDMESYGIDFICDKEKLPYIIIKKPFDIVGEKSKKVDLSELEKSLKGFNYQDLIKQIIIFIENNKKLNNTEFEVLNLKQKFKLTFSETQLLKKYINKNIAFGDNTENIIKIINTKEKKEIQNLIKK